MNPMSTKEAREALEELNDPGTWVHCRDKAYPVLLAALNELDERRALTQDIRTCAKFTLANSKGYVADAERLLAFLDGCSVTHSAGDDGTTK